MFWQKPEKNERRIIQLQNTLEKSFGNVKNDTQNIFRWLGYLYNQNNQQQKIILDQQQQIQKLENDLQFVPKNAEQIKRIIDSYYSFEGMLTKIRELNHKVETLSAQREQDARYQLLHQEAHKTEPEKVILKSEHDPFQNAAISEIKQRLGNLEEQRKATVREKVIKRVAKNSKEYVKSLIMSYIRKYNQISALQLKEMVVEDQGLVSKSSFYRLLEELEELHEVSVVRQGKQKYYAYKVSKNH